MFLVISVSIRPVSLPILFLQAPDRPYVSGILFFRDEIQCHTAGLRVPPLGHVDVDGRRLYTFVKNGTETTQSAVEFRPDPVANNSKVVLPSKVFVVQIIILVQQYEVIGQLFHRGKIKSVDVRLGRCQPLEIVVHIENDWHDIVVDHPEKFLCHVIAAERVVQAQVEFIITLHLSNKKSIETA